jgi:hypothetical protein
MEIKIPSTGHRVLDALLMIVVIVAMFVLAGVLVREFDSLAHADPDPHMPNMQAGYCPGGGTGSQIYLAYRDGVPYPNGSYWHAIQYGVPVIGHPDGALSPGLQCVVGGGAVS